jgi:3-hydroxyacyl-CoA dehydrogenase
MATEEASKQGCDYYDFAVIGAGRMGASIAGALALNGARVAVHDRSDFDRKKGFEIMRADMKQHEEEGLISEEGRKQALDHVFLVNSLEEVNSQRKLARYGHRCYASRREQQ